MTMSTSDHSPVTPSIATARRQVPPIVRSVMLLDLMLGLWAIGIAAGYLYLWSENYRLNIDGKKVGNQGVFFSILVNVRWASSLMGMDEIPGGGHSKIPGGPTMQVLGTYRMMSFFPWLAASYLALAGFWLALADGLTRGLRWARRTQATAGWIGLASIVGYFVLYILSPLAPRVGLFVVAGAALVPLAMIRSSRQVVEEAAIARAKIGLPGWTMIAGGLAVVALAIHLVLAWWGLLALKAFL